MQVYVPTTNLLKNALILDSIRLNAQLGEMVQIIKAASGVQKGWSNHPATIAWKHNTNAYYKKLRKTIK